MDLFDTHCHIDLEAFDKDRSQVLSDARRGGVANLLVPAVQKSTWAGLLELCESDPQLHPALGLHPVYLQQHRVQDTQALAEQIARCRPVAIGEIEALRG